MAPVVGHGFTSPNTHRITFEAINSEYRVLLASSTSHAERKRLEAIVVPGLPVSYRIQLDGVVHKCLSVINAIRIYNDGWEVATGKGASEAHEGAVR